MLYLIWINFKSILLPQIMRPIVKTSSHQNFKKLAYPLDNQQQKTFDSSEDTIKNKMVESSDKKNEKELFVSDDSNKTKREQKLSESSSIERVNSDDDDSSDGKPNHSYISLIANAILASRDKRLVLSDIYNYVQENYPYFKNRGQGWRNSIRHNLSLNECFIKAGRSPNGKGHYWAINPANYDDFSKGDFRRRRAQRRARGRNMLDFVECYPYLYYPPHLSSMARAHGVASYPSPPPTIYHRPSPTYIPPISPTYIPSCRSVTCVSPPSVLKKDSPIISKKATKRGFDMESILRDDDKPAAKICKRPSSTEITPPLPPLYRSSTLQREYFTFPEKRTSSAFHSTKYSDIPYQTMDKYRSLFSSSVSSKSHFLHNDSVRIPLVQ